MQVSAEAMPGGSGRGTSGERGCRAGGGRMEGGGREPRDPPVAAPAAPLLPAALLAAPPAPAPPCPQPHLEGQPSRSPDGGAEPPGSGLHMQVGYGRDSAPSQGGLRSRRAAAAPALPSGAGAEENRPTAAPGPGRRQAGTRRPAPGSGPRAGARGYR